MKDIAGRQHLSRKYLEHIASRLKAAGLLRSVRGTRASTSLARPASDIRLSEIFQVLEGPFALVECIDGPERCPRSSACATRDIWTQMEQLLRGFLESITLEDLCRQQREKERPAGAMYHI